MFFLRRDAGPHIPLACYLSDIKTYTEFYWRHGGFSKSSEICLNGNCCDQARDNIWNFKLICQEPAVDVRAALFALPGFQAGITLCLHPFPNWMAFPSIELRTS